MRTKRGLALAPLGLAVFIALAGLFAPAADARRGACVPGQKKPKCQVWTAKVKAVADGDTINLKIKEKGGFSERRDVRLIGVQAMELTEYSRKKGRAGECHAVEATERLEELILGRTVRLSSRKVSSEGSGTRRRLLRSVAFKQGGNWQDAGSLLLAEGHALWDPHGTEWAWNRTYAKLSQFAARSGDGIWDTDSCGAGPDAALNLKVKWDAEGQDGRNVNGEFIRITNSDPVNDFPLGGWWTRDSFLRRYTFPAGAVVPAGGSIRLRVGSGTNNASTFFWRERAPVFENVQGGSHAIGDGAYLFDPDGDLRFWQVYPCAVGCSEPLKGKVKMSAHRTTPEAITVENTSSQLIDLTEYEVESSPYFYEFAPRTILPPGGSIVINVAGKPADDTEFVKNWGFKKFLLADKKDVVTLRNPLGTPVTCAAWGRGTHCPGV
jgi:endonuclease YncB( thermonuclease family)